jgi:hypothetical protein
MASVNALNFSSRDESNYSFNQWELVGSSGRVLILFPFDVKRALLPRDDVPIEIDVFYGGAGS